MQPLERIAPGIAELRNYTWDDAPADVQAGLSVAAVAIPVAIAYAELAGFPPRSPSVAGVRKAAGLSVSARRAERGSGVVIL